MMKRATAFLAGIVLIAAASAVHADYSVSDKGMWPESWPKELEPLRKQARTLVGPMVDNRHYEIPFTKREEFETAWPHLLKVKGKGAPLILVRGPKTDFMEVKPAGVLIHSPPAGTANPEARTLPIVSRHGHPARAVTRASRPWVTVRRDVRSVLRSK
jgi:hypothetical protein